MKKIRARRKRTKAARKQVQQRRLRLEEDVEVGYKEAWRRKRKTTEGRDRTMH